MTSDKKANRLISESSPYLLQHAYNPVDWYPWSDEALDKAVKLDKPILVSIGYSACHWCHVMERESFENIRISSFLNKNFISIKVDREERPDIDHVYMDAVHAMGIQGGWPLNVFLTPEQKPFFGGTYFPPQTFLEILENVITAYNTRREKLDLSATELANHLSKSEVVKYGLSGHHSGTDENDLLDSLEKMRKKFDLNSGGFDKAPKFPMPSLWEFILRCGYFLKESKYIKHAIFTLQKMARGGIYDQLGGGFARYSVDDKWFVPHFEKMLYDNGQLLSLYAEAFILSGEEEFAEVIRGIADFLMRELRHPDSGYFAALDADSEGVEGKFYTWRENEFKRTVGKEADFWSDYFGISRDGNWENQENIITRHKNIVLISDKFNCSLEEAKNILSAIKKRLLEKREERARPGLDDKILAGWNGIALIGLLDAYNALNDESLLQQALDNANYLLRNHIREQQLFRTAVGKGRLVPGYLEDYAFVIQGFIKLYQVTFDELWLWKAKEMTAYTLENFFDEDEGFFYYSDKNIRQLIAIKKEVFDNVIPSSNSVMAENLYLLGFFFDEESFRTKAEGMMDRMKKLLMTEPEYSANWGKVYLMMTHPIAEIAIIGKDSMTIRNQINKHYHPNKIFCGTNLSSELPLLKDRKNFMHNTIYVCYNKSCNLPVHTAEEAIKLLV